MAEHQPEEQNWRQKMTSTLYGLRLSERTIWSRRRSRYIFTDNKHPVRGVFSAVIGLMSFLSLSLSVFLTYVSGRPATDSYALGVIWALLFAIVGLVLGILSTREKDIYLLFPRLGILINALTLVCVIGIFVIGIVGM